MESARTITIKITIIDIKDVINISGYIDADPDEIAVIIVVIINPT